jgi:hypothetical protein
MRRLKRSLRASPLAAGLLSTGVFAALLLGAAAWRHGRWVVTREHYLDFALAADPRIACRESCPPLTPEQANLLGWATPSASPQAYFRLPERKRPGVTRVGVFGCSFVAGQDAAPRQDFPNLLQEALRKAGRRDIEVVNFGVSGYGMHQSFLLWSLLSARYGLDYSVFMPMVFHGQRDDTFVLDPKAYGPVHSRYALVDGKPLLIPAAGGSPAERSRRYFRPLPLWRYLRYDSRPPALLRSLLPPGRQWKGNPFYYWKGPDDEALELYTALFSSAAAAPGRLVVDSDSSPLVGRLQRALDGRAVVFASRVWDLTFRDKELYYSPSGHLSALGNWLRARELLALFTGKPAAEFEAPTLRPLPASAAPRARTPRLDRASRVEARIGALPAASFVYYDGVVGLMADPPPDFKRDKIAALLLSDGVDRPIIGLNEPLEDGERLFVRFTLDGTETSAPFGRVETRDGVTGRVRPAGAKVEGREAGGAGRAWELVISSGDYLTHSSLLVPGIARDLRLESSRRTLLRGRLLGSRDIEWRPAEAPHFLYLRVPESGWIEPARYRGGRTLDLVVRGEDGRESRSPLYALAWKRVRLPVPELAPKGKTGTIAVRP